MDFLLRIFTVYFPSVKHPRKSNLLLSPTSKLHPLPMAVNAMRRSFKLIMAHHQPPLCISVNANLFVRQIVANHFYFYLAFCAEPRICLLQRIEPLANHCLHRILFIYLRMGEYTRPSPSIRIEIYCECLQSS